MPSESSTFVSQLTGYRVFADCSKDDVSALVKAGGRFTLPAGWPLVQEGIPSDACYVITEGSALVFVQRQQVAEIGVGDVVGEMTLLDGGQRNATVTSNSRVAGLRIENDKLQPVLDSHPKLADAFRAVYDAHQK